MTKTKTCPHCGNEAKDTISGALIRRRACSSAARSRVHGAGSSGWLGSAYHHPGLGFTLFRATGMHTYVSVPGAADLI